MTFDSIPKFVINLPSREDRLEDIAKEFEKHGIDFTVWPAVDGKHLKINPNSKKANEYNAKGILGCMKSHYNLIQHAKINRYKYIAVFEDDILLSVDFEERVNYLLSEDFDVAYLGGQFDRLGRDLIPADRKYIFKVCQVGGTYAYIIRNTVYDYILKNMNYNWGVDQFYADRVQKEFNCIAFYPFGVLHLDGMSDVAMHDAKYANIKKHCQLKRIL